MSPHTSEVMLEAGMLINGKVTDLGPRQMGKEASNFTREKIHSDVV